MSTRTAHCGLTCTRVPHTKVPTCGTAQGTYTTPKGEEKVVMKRVKARVEGAEEMHEMELQLNLYAAKVAKGHCADFLGYCTVTEKEATPSLTAGLWLVRSII